MKKTSIFLLIFIAAVVVLGKKYYDSKYYFFKKTLSHTYFNKPSEKEVLKYELQCQEKGGKFEFYYRHSKRYIFKGWKVICKKES